MVGVSSRGYLRPLHGLLELGTFGQLTDVELLARFTRREDAESLCSRRWSHATVRRSCTCAGVCWAKPTTPRTSFRQPSWSSPGVPNRSLVQRSSAPGSEASRRIAQKAKVADHRRRLHERRIRGKIGHSRDVWRRILRNSFTKNLTGCPNHCEPP